MCAVRMMFPCGNDVCTLYTLTAGTHYIMLPKGNTSLAKRHHSPKGQSPEVPLTEQLKKAAAR